MLIWGRIAGLCLIIIVLLDAFETIVLPRRITHKLRLTRLFYRATWMPWSAIARRISRPKLRENFLSYFGPLSLLLLLATWAVGLILSFALLQRSVTSPSQPAMSFGDAFYYSGTTFLTLGLGDIAPHMPAAKTLTVLEAAFGFGLLALVIGYLPTLYQAFSGREVNIVLLDARAGSPPTAAELLRRHSSDHGLEALQHLLQDWERWSAELLESHISYPVVAYYRSQHNNQSWLAALTAILDTSAIVIAGVDGACARQAELTFAIARHAVVDLSQVFGTPPRQDAQDRLPPADLVRLRRHLLQSGLRLRQSDEADGKLVELRRKYEPYVEALGAYLLMAVPPWWDQRRYPDNWQTTAWEKSGSEISAESPVPATDDHL